MTIAQLKHELEEIYYLALRCAHRYESSLKKVHQLNYHNALNLIHYLLLRSLDIRQLQEELHAAGLSSLASSESHVLAQITSILNRLGSDLQLPGGILDFKDSVASLEKKNSLLFGRSHPSIMVTLDPSETDKKILRKYVEAGMTAVRINCAHDNSDDWFRMIQLVNEVSADLQKECKIFMDLAGPKIRTVLKKVKSIPIEVGQTIRLTDEQHLGDEEKGAIGCTVDDIAQQLRPGEKVLFDDGSVEAIVQSVDTHHAEIKIVRISAQKPVLKREKGINFPQSFLTMPALTEYDRQCLSFALRYADMIGYSFVRNTDDLQVLKEAMGARRKPVVLKIETSESVANLPALLLAALEEERCGVMIARGDLAVEIGFERLSEVQEEILWICEAAHVPVVWATQVLESLNKTGIATRAEITDAAHAIQADCVMINKGPNILGVVHALKDILSRSGSHQRKKRYTFRPLNIASNFFEDKK